MNKKSVLIGCLDYMHSMDSNGTWNEASEDIAHGEITEDEDIQFTIETLKAWCIDLVNDTDDKAEQMKNDMSEWIAKLEKLI